MAVFKYRAINNSGKIIVKYMDARNESDLERRIKNLGYRLIKCNLSVWSIFRFRGEKFQRREVIAFTLYLQQLMASGVPIIDALKDLSDNTESAQIKNITLDLIYYIEGGMPLSRALENYPGLFNRAYISMIRVGEETGCLDEVLDDLVDILKWNDNLIKRIKKAMIYPGIMSITVILVISFLVIFLVPKLIPFIESMGGEIPLYTIALMDISELIQNNGFDISVIILMCLLVARRLMNKNKKMAYQMDKAILKCYFIGPLVLKLSLSRFCRYFSMMYRSGINIMDALKISEHLMANRVIKDELREARKNIADGMKISDAFSEFDHYPSFFIHMLRLGEVSGRLDLALNNVSYFYNKDINDIADNVEVMILPMLTVIIGAVMLWVVMAALYPVYGVMTKLII